MLWKRKHKVEPKELAQSLTDEFVRKIVVDVAKDLNLDATTRARYETKMKLYQLAAVLMALMGMEQKNPRFLAVREHFEKNVFPPSPEQGAEILAEVKKAMRDLNDLIIPAERQGKEMPWARAWLHDIGVNETNPVTFALFAHHWTTYYIMVIKTLREFDPAA